MISEADYCAKVCGARCCYLGNTACPSLTSENKCGMFNVRFAPGMPDLVYIGYHKGKVFHCSRIKTIMHRLPKEITDQCCIAKPELLKKNYNV